MATKPILGENLNVLYFGVAWESTEYISRSESYSVLSPFLSKLRYAYRRNRQNLFYLLVYFKKLISICLFYLQNSIFSVSLTMF